MISARKLALEEFHQLALTGDQLNTIAFAVRTLQDRLEQERSEDPEIDATLTLIDQIMISIDSTR